MGKLVHVNNAVQFEKPDKQGFFGRQGGVPSEMPFEIEREINAEKSRFTRRWGTYSIHMDGDICNDIRFPSEYRMLGYSLGVSARCGSPEFTKISETTAGKFDFTPRNKTVLNSSVGFFLQMPDASSKSISAGYNLGAVQEDGVYEKLDSEFEFLPCLEWLPELTNDSSCGSFV